MIWASMTERPTVTAANAMPLPVSLLIFEMLSVYPIKVLLMIGKARIQSTLGSNAFRAGIMTGRIVGMGTG